MGIPLQNKEYRWWFLLCLQLHQHLMPALWANSSIKVDHIELLYSESHYYIEIVAASATEKSMNELMNE